MKDTTDCLKGYRVAVPEKRQLDILANLLQRRGAKVRRCPLVAIHDSPHTNMIKQWLEDFIKQPPDWLILLTGEGVHRLLSFIERHHLDRDAFVRALHQCQILARGPKPGRALRLIGIQPTELAIEPTTLGVIQSLDKMSLQGVRVSVQLYGDDPNVLLINYLQQRDVQFNTVAPYVYADETEQQQAFELIEELLNHQLDAIAFTSKAQVRRLFSLARKNQMTDPLVAALNRMTVAAIGPVVVDELLKYRVIARVSPVNKYYMKPLVTELVTALSASKRVLAGVFE